LLLPSIEAGGDEFPMNFYSPARLLAFIHEFMNVVEQVFSEVRMQHPA
jgi:hypothetical protein